VIQGVTLTLKQAEAGTNVTVKVSNSSSSAKSKIENFVTAFNDVVTYIHDQFKYDPDEPNVMPLRGDDTLRSIQRKLKSIVSSIIPGLSEANINGLSQIGITSSSKDGTLSITDSILTSSIESDPQSILKLFLGEGTPSDSSITYVSKTDATQAGEYSIDITRVAQQAVVTGDQVIQSSGLAEAEVLTFTFNDNATNSQSIAKIFSVTLAAGSTINSIVDSLNSAFATEGVDLTASNSSGTLRIASNDYGDEKKLTVVSNKASSSAQSGIGLVPKTSTGVDIAGYINGHPATGDGKTLTGAEGFKEEGLKISSTTTATGLKGTITVSFGVGEQLQTYLAHATDPNNGTIKTKQDALQDIIDDYDEEIARKEQLLIQTAEELQRQFVALEGLLSSLQTQSNFLNLQLAQMASVMSFGN
jgi:flagellar hook-associated protein 2